MFPRGNEPHRPASLCDRVRFKLLERPPLLRLGPELEGLRPHLPIGSVHEVADTSNRDRAGGRDQSAQGVNQTPAMGWIGVQ